MAEECDKNWLGTPLSDLYKDHGPVAPILCSKYHNVLYELPATLEEVPKAHFEAQPKHWDDDFIKMPYSPQSLFIGKDTDEIVVQKRWQIITEALSKPILSFSQLESAISCYNNKLPKFTALKRFFEEEESEIFFKQLLPKIIKLALSLPEIVPGSIPLLQKHHCKAISLSQLQISCLLANAFLCTFLWDRKMAGTYPGINFIRLFTADEKLKRQSCVMEKLKCIMHYFRRVTEKGPVGVITFQRQCISRKEMPRWDSLEKNLGNTKIHITSTGTIEESQGFLQVDFANRMVGGGVLGYGCVQEEIRFITCPEAIISRLFTEELENNEALIITGIETYSKYSGYSDAFQWCGDCKDETPYDDYGRKRTSLAVIDATRFSRVKDQYHCSAILRELNKAYVGFSSREKQNLAPVATGNWGCGAFNGDPNLKSLIQLMACSASGRDLVYYSFGNTELRDEFYKMYTFLANNQITICQLWRYLCRFCGSNLAPERLYSFIQQCHFDLKKQPIIKQFVTVKNTQKRKPETVQPTSSQFTEESKSPKVEQIFFPELPIRKPLSSDEIIQIFEEMDGPKIQTEVEEVTVTLLEAASRVRKKETAIAMEIDENEEEKPLSFIKDKKRKITDYFSKVTGS